MTPKTPEEAIAARNRVLALLENVTPGEWHSEPDIRPVIFTQLSATEEHKNAYPYDNHNDERHPERKEIRAYLCQFNKYGGSQNSPGSANSDAELMSHAKRLAEDHAELLGAYARTLDVLQKAEWSATRASAPMGSMWHNTPGPQIPACPFCRGVHPEKGKHEFIESALGHRPDCIFRELATTSS